VDAPPSPAPPVPLAYDVVDRGGSPERLLVLIHGYARPPSDLTERLHLLDPDRRFLAVAPHAPYRHRDQVIWHKPGGATGTEEQYMGSLAALDDLLGTLQERTGLPASEAVVGGFSQGGGLALSMLFHADAVHRPAIAFGVCSFPAPVRGFPVERAAAVGRPAFLLGARRDRFAPIEVFRGGAALIASTGIDLTYVEHDAEHEMTDAAAAEVAAWLAGVLSGEVTGSSGRELYDGAPVPGFFDGLWSFRS
jgi:predicted esterase